MNYKNQYKMNKAIKKTMLNYIDRDCLSIIEMYFNEMIKCDKRLERNAKQRDKYYFEKLGLNYFIYKNCRKDEFKIIQKKIRKMKKSEFKIIQKKIKKMKKSEFSFKK